MTFALRDQVDMSEATVTADEKRQEHGWMIDGWIHVLKLNKSRYAI